MDEVYLQREAWYSDHYASIRDSNLHTIIDYLTKREVEQLGMELKPYLPQSLIEFP